MNVQKSTLMYIIVIFKYTLIKNINVNIIMLIF